MKLSVGYNKEVLKLKLKQFKILKSLLDDEYTRTPQASGRARKERAITPRAGVCDWQ